MADNAQSILRRLREMSDNPRLYLEMLTDRLANFNKGRVAEIRPEGAGYRKLTPKERTEQMVSGALDNLGGGGLGALGVIKGKGGNWLTGSVEDALGRLKQPISSRATQMDRELIEAGMERSPNVLRKEALNKWIEGPLTKYVKRDMATEGDPVRKLAEQGILHFEPSAISRNVDSATYANRGAQGFEPWGKAESDLAKSWENLSDRAVMSGFAGKMSEAAKAQNPWLEKLAAEDRVYQPARIGYGETGFSHLTDELSNALNPESGLPRNLLLTPEQMQQIGMEKAVRHVADINAWRAAQKAEADLARSQSPAVQLFKEYAENNPKGLRWVELKAPADVPVPEFTRADQSFTQRGLKIGDQYYQVPYGKEGVTHESVAQAAARRKMLEDQLKYEGDTMGHCVGGYCDGVLSGRSRIFSLRDAKGQPHVTIETRPSADYADTQSIVQIKGKANLAPKEDYLPFVQDFVKSGKWSDVGDLSNTGLRRMQDAFNENERKILRSAGHELTDYMTPEQIEALQGETFDKALEVWRSQNTPKFAEGGSVKPNAWRPMELDGIMVFINE